MEFYSSDCPLLNVFIVLMKFLLAKEKNSGTTLVVLAFKLWSKSNLVNNSSPWPGGSYIHMSKYFRMSANRGDFCEVLRADLIAMPLSHLLNKVHL